MSTLNEFPKIMRQAREDLCATVSGRFSPQDWESILTLAQQKLLAQFADPAPSRDEELRVWQAVILDFNRNSYWGFEPNYKEPKKPKAGRTDNLGVRFIVFTFLSFTLTLMAVVWTGQIYTTSDEALDAYIFFFVLSLVVANFAFLLWKTRNYRD